MSAFLGQVALHSHPIMGQASCPVGAATGPYDPSLNCMRDARGNTVCSDGKHYPPGCPRTPPAEYFTPGVTPDVTTNGRIEGQIPAPRQAPAPAPAPAVVTPPPAPSGGFPIVPVAIGGGLAAAGFAAYMLLR